MSSSRLKLIMVPVIIVFLLLPVLNHFVPVGFFFEGTLAENKKWFPTAWFLSFAFFKSFYPLACAVGLYLVLKNKLSAPFIALFIIAQTALLIWCLEVTGFVLVAWYAYLLLGTMLLSHIPAFPGSVFSGFMGRILNPKLLDGSFLFIIYIILCLNLNRFHPFAKYTMFNKFADNTSVFLLRDSRDSVLPLNTYTTIDGNHLFELYIAINNKHGFNYGWESMSEAEQNIVSREMLETVFKNLKRPIPSDSVKLSVINFYLKNGKLNSNETQLYTGKVE